MQSTFPCPVCVSDAWEHVGTHPYWRADHEPAGIWHGDQEVRLRRQILFDVWFPGAASVTLRSRRCGSCGTICYAPRPTHSDLIRKYEFMRAALAGSPPVEVSPRVEALDRARAATILAALEPYVPSGARVLDVGGGDGRLMGAFIEKAFECFLVDWVDRTRTGVRKLADSLEALPAVPAFDVAVCSHVLEHVASPREFLEQIYVLLRPGGAVYVEVPLETFHSNASNPIVAQPVEHINFFTQESIRRLLSGAGFETDGARIGSSSYEGRPLPVIRAVALKRKYPDGAASRRSK